MVYVWRVQNQVSTVWRGPAPAPRPFSPFIRNGMGDSLGLGYVASRCLGQLPSTLLLEAQSGRQMAKCTCRFLDIPYPWAISLLGGVQGHMSEWQASLGCHVLYCYKHQSNDIRCDAVFTTVCVVAWSGSLGERERDNDSRITKVALLFRDASLANPAAAGYFPAYRSRVFPR